MRATTRGYFVGLICAVHLGVASAWAQPGAPEPAAVREPTAEAAHVERARALFERGLQHVEQEQWQEAAGLFQRVLSLQQSDVVAYNLASALVHLGRLSEAVELLTPIANAPSTPEVEEAAKQLLAQVEPQVGYVSVRFEGDAQGLALLVNTRRFDTAWMHRAIPVAPGEVTLGLVRGDEPVALATTFVTADASTTVVTLQPRPKPTPITAPREVAEQARAKGPAQTASASGPAWSDKPVRTDEGSGNLTNQWWFWTAGAGVALGTVILVALMASSGSPSPRYVEGDAGLIVGKVMPIPQP